MLLISCWHRRKSRGCCPESHSRFYEASSVCSRSNPYSNILYRIGNKGNLFFKDNVGDNNCEIDAQNRNECRRIVQIMDMTRWVVALKSSSSSSTYFMNAIDIFKEIQSNLNSKRYVICCIGKSPVV